MPSRRRLLAGTAGLITTGFAGCTGDDSESESGSNGSETSQEVDSYTVTVEPNGSYTFDSVPETYAVIPSAWLDIGMALGKHPTATTDLERAPLKFYDLLPDVTFDEDEVMKLAEGSESGYDQENFYAADCDVHLIDPRSLERFTDWEESDMEEIEETTGPFLGSDIRFGPTAPFGGETYYTLYEAFEKAAEIFQRQERYQAWESLHAEFMENIESELPPEDERPTVMAIWRGVDPDSGQFFLAPVHRLQNNTKPYYRLGMRDAFEEDVPDGPVGYEELLDADPDYIGAVGGLTSMTHEEFVETVVEPFENNSNGEGLTAVQEGNIVRTGGQYMGPIVDLFSTEALAKMVFPDSFGEWPGSSADVPEDEQLFDRQEVSDIINGNL